MIASCVLKKKKKNLLPYWRDKNQHKTKDSATNSHNINQMVPKACQVPKIKRGLHDGNTVSLVTLEKNCCRRCCFFFVLFFFRYNSKSFFFAIDYNHRKPLISLGLKQSYSSWERRQNEDMAMHSQCSCDKQCPSSCSWYFSNYPKPTTKSNALSRQSRISRRRATTNSVVFWCTIISNCTILFSCSALHG